MSRAQVAADLRAAADLLRRDGWTQRTYHRKDGCHCAEGAIAAVIGQHVYEPTNVPVDIGALHLTDGWWTAGGPEEWKRRSAAEDALLSYLAVNVDAVCDWNDDEDRTAEEVIAALEAAADAAEVQS